MKADEQNLIEQIKEHSKADETFLITSSYLLQLASRAFELFESSQTQQKRQLLNFMFANMQAKAGKLVWELKNPFAGMVECTQNGKWLPRLDSNQ
jgi:site-specific DNA recombinase